MIGPYSTPLPTAEAAADPWQIQSATIANIQTEMEGVATYDLKIRDPQTAANYRFAPGQFNMLYLPGAGEIAISVSDNPVSTESIAHTIRVAGNVTGTLASMQVGQTLGLRGPFGTSWPIANCVGRDIVLVAGGIGLAPLRPVIFTIVEHRRQFGRVHLLYGARSPDTLLYERAFEAWSDQGINIQTTVDRSDPGWQGNVGVVTMLLEQLTTFDAGNTVLMCCGPEVMMRFTIMSALKRGLLPDQIYLSMERNMQCAVGLCGHCQLGPAFVCKDGPVFRYDKIAPFIDIEAL